MEPGCKYDNMLILSEPQGLGKSLLLDKMSKGWFNDTIRTFEGKEASELLQGVWLVEFGRKPFGVGVSAKDCILSTRKKKQQPLNKTRIAKQTAERA